MVDPMKSYAEINLYDLSLLPTVQCTLQCMRRTQKCITGKQTFPISKLGGWKHTTAFHKSSEESRHQALKHLWQYWCHGNRSVVGNRGGRWTLWNRDDIGLSPASRETTQTNKPPIHYTMSRGQNISCSLKKKRKHTQWVRAPIRSKSNKRRLTSLDLIPCEWRSTDSLDCLPSKSACQRAAQEVLPMRVGGATCKLYLPSLTALSVVSCGRLQLGVPHWATSVDCCK